MHCHYFDANLCRSCTRMGEPYDLQVARKTQAAAELLAPFIKADAWLPPALSKPESFRNKVKLAVGGTLEAPTLGLTGLHQPDVDLRECGIQERAIWDVIPDLAGFVTYLGLEPYNVTERTGTLKFIHVTSAPSGDLMLRFVVQNADAADRLRACLPALLERLPQVRVVSANILAEHVAALAGPEEIALTPEDDVVMQLDDVSLYLRAHSFFQTNTGIATQLYTQARTWLDAIKPDSVLDLYCGVGPFALFAAAPGRTVHGLEVEPSAVSNAQRSAAELATRHPECGPVTFAQGDASALAVHEPAPDVVIVNPPRRGIEELADELNASTVKHVIYSSCNPHSLAHDLERMPNYRVQAARLFDMFPQTDHAEVAVLLERAV